MIKIYLDPGHGGTDPGATANGLKEKNIVLDIAKKLKNNLQKYSGVKVRLSRTNDTFISLSQRASDANSWGADIFVSIHINAGGGTGFESFIYNGNVSGKTVSNQNTIHKEIMKQINVKDRGKKKANLAVLRQSKMPAILTEVLFIDTKADAGKLKDSKFIDKVVTGHENGIVKALGLKGSNDSGKNSNSSENNPTTSWKKVTGNWTGQTLGNGEYGEPVKQLQEKLASNNPPFYPNKGAKNNGIDSYYGDDTEDAVRRFQSYYGLDLDGLAGKQVYNQLKGSSNRKNSKSISKGSKVTAKRLYVNSQSTKNVRSSSITGIVDTINNSWRNEIRLKDNKGNYIGFTRKQDLQ